MASIDLLLTLQLLLLAARVPAQDFDPVAYAVTHMCSRWFHQSTIKNGILYIDGGLESFDLDSWSESFNGYNEALIRVDLTGPWDWHNSIFEEAVNKSSGVGGFTGQAPPNLINGAIYAGSPEDPRLYFYGGTTSYWNTSFPGWQQPYSSQYGLWSYDLTTLAWNQYDISKASPYRPSRGLSAEAADQSLAFYLNGQIDNGSSSSTTTLGDGQAVALSGMVVVDTTTQEARNISTGVDKSVLPWAGGRMVYIPSYGVHGILVALGGLSASEGQATKSTLTDTASFLSMSDILVYDINGYYDGYDGWYRQQATGDLPAARTDTCVVVASTADNSSHSIYMYGGRGAGDITFDDVYVLSIPTFTWTRVYGPGQSPRYGHSCHVVGSQMVTVGGLVKSPVCDWETKGVAIFEMSTVNWTSQYTPQSPPYVLPSVVAAKAVDTNGTTYTQPMHGFDDPQLAQLLSSSKKPVTIAASHKLNGGAVAGCAVGGCIFLIFALAIGLWWRKHRRLVRHRDTEQHLSPGFDSELDSSEVCEKSAEPKTMELVSNRGEAHELEQPSVAHEKCPDDYVCELDADSRRKIG